MPLALFYSRGFVQALVVMALGLCLLGSGQLSAEDRSNYDGIARPKVLINWESFEAQGIPSDWKIPFQNVVINAYTRMNRVLGVDVRPQFWGYTTRTDSNPGEIVISMNERHANSRRLASTFGNYPDRLKIVFHRKRGSDLTPWNWTPFWPNEGQYSMQAVMMHEFGHALGLDHSAPSKSIMGSYSWTSHHGPWSGDISDIRAVHSLQNENRLRQYASYNGAASWSTLSNDVTGFSAPWGRTTNRVAAAGNSSTGQYIVGWSTADNRLTWVRGDGVDFPADNWQGYSSHPRPRYGSAMASDHGNNWLWVVVDGRSDDNRLKVIRSTNHGDSWQYTAFPVATTASTPGIARVQREEGGDAWIVLWVNYDESDRGNTGFIYGSVSFDNGESWSSPQQVDDFYRVHDGVSLGASADGRLMVSFVWSGELDDWEYGQNKIRSFALNLSDSGELSFGPGCYSSEHSRIAPDIAWHSTTNRFVVAHREQDFNTSLNSRFASGASCPGNRLHIPGTTTEVAPGMAENPAWEVSGVGTEVVIWGARD